MDSLVYLAALGVGIAVMTWHLLNEGSGSEGAIGLFALRSDDRPADLTEDAAEAGRYHIRPRLTPDNRAGLNPSAPRKAYRARAAAKFSRGGDGGSAAVTEIDPG